MENFRGGSSRASLSGLAPPLEGTILSRFNENCPHGARLPRPLAQLSWRKPPNRKPAAEFIKTANLWQVIQAGGPAMIPLGFLSVITLSLDHCLLVFPPPGEHGHQALHADRGRLIRKRDFPGSAGRFATGTTKRLRASFNASWIFSRRTRRPRCAEIREIAQTEGVRQASALNQQIAYLADIGTISPMVGLLGTVIGIVRSFGVIAIDAAATRPTMLAQGIGEALIATAAGLLIGIPAMAAYSYFRGRAHALISELEAASTQLLALLSTIGVKNVPGRVADRERGSVMNFRTHVYPERIVFQIAPMVDILLFLLVFFMLTWNFSRNEAELDVKVPAAREGKENRRPAGEVILNVKKDGAIVMNRRADVLRRAAGNPHSHRQALPRPAGRLARGRKRGLPLRC